MSVALSGLRRESGFLFFRSREKSPFGSCLASANSRRGAMIAFMLIFARQRKNRAVPCT
jgi:hypothetical protein